MIDDEDVSRARQLLSTARVLIDRASIDTRGLWPRAAVLLARQSLEVALKTYWSAVAPGVEDCSARAQLLCLGSYARDDEFARRANQVWTTLSRAAHFHPYELPPTHEELIAWFEGVTELIEKTEAQVWGQ
jgi:hypothetical protein